METIVYALLVLTSVIGLTFIVERGLALRWRKVLPPEIEAAVESCQAPEDVPMLKRVCQQHTSPLSRLLLLAVDHLTWPKADNTDALQTRARHEIVWLERGLVVLEIIVGIAPLLGLVGTIVGMMTAFGDVGQAAQIDAAKLAQGIALILRHAHHILIEHVLAVRSNDGALQEVSQMAFFDEHLIALGRRLPGSGPAVHVR